MKIKSLLILVLSLVTLTAFGQDGGIKGRVVSRAGRIALGDVKITMTPGGTTTVSDAQGNFVSKIFLRANIRCSSKLPNSRLRISPYVSVRRCATSMR